MYLRQLQTSTDEADHDAGSLGAISGVSLFFMVWNCAMANTIVSAVRMAFQGDYSGLPIFCCPHWLIGIVVPVLAGYSVGWSFLALSVLLTIVIPYSFAVVILQTRGGRQESSDNHPEIVEEVLATNDRNSMERRASVLAQIDDFLSRYGGSADAKERWDFDEEIVDNGFLIVKKAIRESKDAKKAVSKDKKNPSYRAANVPKTDIYLPPAESGSSRSSPSSRENEFSCAICLEEYQDGEAIAWSKNKACHHAHHHKCLLKWLADHEDCPSCRRPYRV